MASDPSQILSTAQPSGNLAPLKRVEEASWQMWCVGLAIGLLLATGFLKLLSIAAGERVLDANDPILGMSYRGTMFCGAILEMGVAFFLASHKRRTAGLLALFWLGMAFCFYHLALAIFEPGSLCPCLGTLYGRIGIKPAMAEIIARVIAVYFLSGPLLLWGMKWKRRKMSTAEDAKSAETGTSPFLRPETGAACRTETV